MQVYSLRNTENDLVRQTISPRDNSPKKFFQGEQTTSRLSILCRVRQNKSRFFHAVKTLVFKFCARKTAKISQKIP